MQMTRTLAAVFVLSAMAIAGSGMASAQSVSTAAGVTVVRGIDGDNSQPPRVVRSRSGVTIYRSESAAPAPEATGPAEAPLQILGGRNLWIVDPESGEVSACSLWYDFYGERTVRCTSDQYR